MARLPIVVLAGTRQRAHEWAADRRISTLAIVFPRNAADLVGLEGAAMILDWSFPSHPKAAELGEWFARNSRP